jgi:hypothetical protein
MHSVYVILRATALAAAHEDGRCKYRTLYSCVRVPGLVCVARVRTLL